MTEKDKKMTLPKITFDEMFTIQGERDAKETIIAIPLSKIDDFPNHPYKVNDDEKMQEMSESIREYGVLQPVIVRKKNDGRYEMISGHRRKRASIIAKKESINAVVKNLTDEEAIILMVDSNESQRSEILPSEKAFAYKMKLEAMKKQAGRPKNNLTPLVSNKRTNEIIGEENGESREQVRRYIRLTELIPEILNMVDEKKIAFRPAVEISYLSEDNQYVLNNIFECDEVTPSLSQAIHLKKLEQEGNLTVEKIEEIMEQEKPNQKEFIKIRNEKIEKYIPSKVKESGNIEEFIIKCIEDYIRHERIKREKNLR